MNVEILHKASPAAETAHSKLDQLKSMTKVVADTGDIEAIKTYKPVDCTTNPSLVLKAMELPAYDHIFKDAVAWGKQQGGKRDAVVSQVASRLPIEIGAELARIVPGRVSTEVDADLSFDVKASLARAHEIIAAYQQRGIDKEKILIKLASTWEGVKAATILEKEGIHCNLTLLFSLIQAVACFKAGVTLVSPFVGRIYDWYVKHDGHDFKAADDPGVLSVKRIYAYARRHGHKTTVMGASFRNVGQVEALAGCDALTISPSLLDGLSKDMGGLKRELVPEQAARQRIGRISVNERSFRWALNEDAMATEKLSEGIRVFAADLVKLRQEVAKRIEA
ncbi:transaldolase [Rhizobiales bacterium GAS191]|jgi:transaldolase|nr:transaldolase [Rhizobiales bacterium GAS113]SEC42827.1 transaldolase [Rhizobiales bacterium GAS191]SEC83244.1 transaldolase [Rhizobiales bacterium GAS188]